MKQSRQTPGIYKALKYLHKKVSNGTFKENELLPSIAQLASGSQVSPHTVFKSLSYLKEQGIIESIRGRRSIVLPGAISKINKLSIIDVSGQEKTINLQLPWQKTMTLIQKDIVKGVFKQGRPLPSFKELIKRYHTSFATLKKSLENLRKKGILIPYKRTYAVRTLTVSQNQMSICFITLADKNKRPIFTSMIEECLKTTESECVATDINFDLRTFQLREDDKLILYNFHGEESPLSDTDKILGFIFLGIVQDTKTDRILQVLTHYNKPIAILDLIGQWKVPKVRNMKVIRHFILACTPLCGQSTIRFLTDLGHRHIAYISPFHKTIWSQNRLKGLQDGISNSLTTTSVYPFSLEASMRYRPELRPIAEKKSNIKKLKTFYHKWKMSIPEEYKRILDPIIEFTVPQYSISIAEIYSRLISLFDQALMNSRITAWVCANDEIALLALDYLQRKKIPVPQKLSVTGFDDSHEAFKNGLTSYNFNMNATVHSMLNYILNRESFTATYGTKIVEIEGIIINRHTTSLIDSSKPGLHSVRY